MNAPALTLLPNAPEPAVLANGRKRHDAYYTQPQLARSLVRRLIADGFVERGCVVLEPSCGVGAFAVAAAELIEPAAIDIVDINPEAVSWTLAALSLFDGVRVDGDTRDFLDHSAIGDYDLILGNPPFSHAEQHVRKALTFRDRGGCVAMLLRLAFLESKERVAFWREHPASKIYVLSERPTFTGGGTDNSAYAFFTWCRGHRGPTELEVVSWREAAS